PIAADFLRARGLPTAGYLHAQQFGYDDSALTFLERELGLERAEGLLRQRLQLWRWQQRWFKPLTKEEMEVAVSTSGRVVGFDHVIADDAAGAALSQAQARARALQFVRAVMHLDPAGWIEVGAERQEWPHRADYLFTWKDAAPLEAGAAGYVAQAEHRHQVRVQGDEVGSYREYLKVPEQWQRDYSRLRSQNNTAGLVDTYLILVLFVAMAFVLVMRIRRGDIRWRLALWVGAAGGVLSFLAALNSIGAARFAYSTTQSWPAFLAAQLLGDAASAIGVGVFLLVLTATAESLYRERFGEQVAVSSYLSWRGLRSKSFFISMVLGLALAAFFFAYQTVFYLVANHFGAWAPADIPYDDLLNTKLPWAFVLFSGFFPAISEEFGFRMLAIPLLEKWFRWLWVAVIAASFLWGFGHATYPNQPFYIRGVEVGLGGVLLSWIMIRYGILTTVVWHYTVDALYTAMLLLRAHDAYLLWSGAATALLAVAPLLAAIWFYRRHRGFLAEGELTNAAAGSAPPLPPPPASARNPALTGADDGAGNAAAGLARYLPISGQDWTSGLIVAAALLSAFAVPMARWDAALPWHASRAQAVASARQFLAKQGFAIAGYRVVAVAATADGSAHGEENAVAAAEIFHRGGRRALLAAFSGLTPTVPAAYWQVRLFQPLQTEEFQVNVRADTEQVIAFAHTLPETAPGGAPAIADAQQRAARFLAAQGINVADMLVRRAQQQRRAARTDSTFVWEAGPARAPLPPGVAYRVQADLAGAGVAHFTAWYYVPEAQVRAFEQSTLGDTLLTVLKGLLYAAAAALLFGLLYRFARTPGLGWSAALKLAAVGGGLTLALSANAVPVAWSAYSTAMPAAAFVLGVWLSVGLAGLGGFLLTLALVAPLAITAPQAGALTRANARRQLERETAWDALWVGVLSLAWTLGWERVQAVINARWHSAGSANFPSPPGGLAQAVPGLENILGAPLHALWVAAGLGILLPVLWRGWHRPAHRRWVVAGVGLMWVGAFPAVHHPSQFALAAIFSGLELLLLFGFAHWFLRDSPLAYLSAALVPALALPGFDWLLQPTAHARPIGVVLLLLAAAWLLGLAWVARGGGGLAPPLHGDSAPAQG
ncbi:MAG: CPBP family glutamic-type intramembrane protease, partial [Terriglobales bacterium]